MDMEPAARYLLSGGSVSVIALDVKNAIMEKLERSSVIGSSIPTWSYNCLSQGDFGDPCSLEGRSSVWKRIINGLPPATYGFRSHSRWRFLFITRYFAYCIFSVLIHMQIEDQCIYTVPFIQNFCTWGTKSLLCRFFLSYHFLCLGYHIDAVHFSPSMFNTAALSLWLQQ